VGQQRTLAALLPGKNRGTPKKVRAFQSRFGRFEEEKNILPLPEFDARPVNFISCQNLTSTPDVNMKTETTATCPCSQ
jgi:hypothetical protein